VLPYKKSVKVRNMDDRVKIVLIYYSWDKKLWIIF